MSPSGVATAKEKTQGSKRAVPDLSESVSKTAWAEDQAPRNRLPVVSKDPQGSLKETTTTTTTAAAADTQTTRRVDCLKLSEDKRGSTSNREGEMLDSDSIVMENDPSLQHDDAFMIRPPSGWTSEQYRALISAIYDEGLKQASPSVIKENMAVQDPVITSERIKSHLQKYRLFRSKSKAEFLTAYDKWMARVTHAVGASDLAMSSATLPSPRDTLSLASTEVPASGELAAYLTYCVIADERAAEQGFETEGSGAAAALDTSGFTHGWLRSSLPKNDDQRRFLAKMITTSTVVFPTLTEEEKRSPLGRMMMHVMALCMELNGQILSLRREDFEETKLAGQGAAHQEEYQAPPRSHQEQEAPAAAHDDDDDDASANENHRERKRPRHDNHPSSVQSVFQPPAPHNRFFGAPSSSDSLRQLSQNYARVQSLQQLFGSSSTPISSNASMSIHPQNPALSDPSTAASSQQTHSSMRLGEASRIQYGASVPPPGIHHEDQSIAPMRDQANQSPDVTDPSTLYWRTPLDDLDGSGG